MANELVLSTLPKTWIFDLDGTLLKHNGYKMYGEDVLLPGAKEYIDTIPKEDFILILTSRAESTKEATVAFLKANNIRYDEVLFDMPLGERIVVNDRKPSGLDTAVAINMERDHLNLPKIVRVK